MTVQDKVQSYTDHASLTLCNAFNEPMKIIEKNLVVSFYHSCDILSGRPIFVESSKNSIPGKGRIFSLKQCSLPADIRGLCGNRVIIIFLTTKRYNWRPSEPKNLVPARVGYCCDAKKGAWTQQIRGALVFLRQKKSLPLGVIFLDPPSLPQSACVQ